MTCVVFPPRQTESEAITLVRVKWKRGEIENRWSGGAITTMYLKHKSFCLCGTRLIPSGRRLMTWQPIEKGNRGEPLLDRVSPIFFSYLFCKLGAGYSYIFVFENVQCRAKEATKINQCNYCPQNMTVLKLTQKFEKKIEDSLVGVIFMCIPIKTRVQINWVVCLCRTLAMAVYYFYGRTHAKKI